MTKEQFETVTRNLADSGKLIEAGWMGFRYSVVDQSLSHTNLRTAFFAGAQHVFASILTLMEPGTEPTDKDIERMDSIHKELRDFTEELLKKLS